MKTTTLTSSRMLIRRAAAAAFAMLAVLATEFKAHATAGTWNGGGLDSGWATTGNWGGGTVAGTSGGTSDATTATFGTTNAAGNGTLLSPIVVDSGRNVKSIAFTGLTTTAGYVIGSTSGNTLTLSSGGAISIGVSTLNQETINAPLVIGASGTAATYSFTSASATPSAGMNIGGTITGGGGTGSLALTFNGGSSGGGGNTSVVSGIISDGGVSDLTSVTVSGASDDGGGNIWKFTGANTYSGGTTMSAGTLIIGNNSALGSGTLHMNGGTFETDGGSYAIANNLLWGNGSSNLAQFAGSGNLTVNGTTSFTNASQRYFNNSTGTLTLAGPVNLSNSASVVTVALVGSGNTVISGTISDGAVAAQNLLFYGPGTLTLSGHAASTGAWGFDGGTVVLDYTSDSATKVGSGTLTLGAVNLELKGGSGTQTVGNVGFTTGGQVNISRLAGSSETLAFGTIANSTAGTTVTAVDFQSGIATTTTATTNGTNVAGSLIGSTTFYTVGSQGAADWAAVSSGSIVSFTAANTAGYTTLASTPAGTNNLVDNSFTTGGAGSVQTLKITATDGNADTLTLGGNLTLGASGGILDSVASANKYTISGNNIILGATGTTNIQQYGNGALEIDSNVLAVSATTVIQKAGPGALILGGTNAWAGSLAINQGTLSAASDANLGGESGTVSVASSSTGSTSVTLASAAPSTLVVGSSLLGSTVTAVAGTSVTLAANANATISSSTNEPYAVAGAIDINGGTLDATGTFSLSESGAATQFRNIVLGTDGGTLQVESGKTLTVGGVISGTTDTLATYDALTKTGSGTLVLGLTGTVTVASATSGSTAVTLASAAPNLVVGSRLLGSTVAAISGLSVTLATGGSNATVSSNTSETFSSGVNTYSGGTYLSGGTLQMGAANEFSTGVGASAISNPFVISGNSTLDLEGFSQFTGALTLVSGTIQDSVGGAALHAFSLNLESGTVSAAIGDYNVGSGGAGIQGALIKTTSGTVILSGLNTYSGGTEINGGVLQVDSVETANTSGPLGGPNNAAATDGGISFGGGTLQYVNGINTFDYSSRIANSTSAISIDTNGGAVTFATALSTTNTGGLTEADTNVFPGTLILSAGNHYSGPTTVTSGTLQTSGSGTLGLTTNALAVNGGILDLDGTSQTVGNFSGAGSTGIILNSKGSSASTLTAGNGTTSGATGTYSGLIEDNAGSGGTVAFSKIGAGTITLAKAAGNTYSGGTTVSAGTLLISNTSNSATGSGALTVAKGATFGGAGGSISSRFDIGNTGATGLATVQVGNGADATSTLTMQGTTSTGTPNNITNANLTFNLNSANTNSNELLVGNSAILFGASAQSVTLTLNLQGANIIAPNTAYILVAGTGNTTMGGTTTGQYAGLSTFVNSLGQNEILNSGNGGSGNLSLALSAGAAGYYGPSYLFIVSNGAGVDDIEVEVVPEPSTWAMMLGGLALLVFIQSRRRRAS